MAKSMEGGTQFCRHRLSQDTMGWLRCSWRDRPEGTEKKKLVPEIIPLLVHPERGGSLSGFPLTGKFMQTLYCSLPMANTGVTASCFRPPPSHPVFGENIVWFIEGVEAGTG